jgi:hypothetical protein
VILRIVASVEGSAFASTAAPSTATPVITPFIFLYVVFI